MAVALALVALAYPLRAMQEQDRRAHLEWMLKSLPNAPQFNEWQQRTGELPPDFDAFPRNNFLPDPFTFMNGKAVRTAADWTTRRTEIRQLLEKWDIGSVPSKATTFKTTVQSETPGNGYATRVVAIEYGPQPDKTATVTVTLTIPQGTGPFPVMIGGAASSLIRRGYIACSYSGTVDAPGTVAQLYPESRLCLDGAGRLHAPDRRRPLAHRAAGRQGAHRRHRLFTRRQDGPHRRRAR